MVTVDTAALDASVARWNSYLASKIDMLQLSGQAVVKKEAQRLVQTLIKVTPPEDKYKTAQSIEQRVDRTFQSLSEYRDPTRSFLSAPTGGRHGNGDVRWYHFTSTGIYGIAAEDDAVGEEEVYKAYFKYRKITKDGRVNVGRRGKQTVYLWKMLVTRAEDLEKLKARLKRHIGRLKGGWLPAFVDLGRPKGEYSPPKWVTKHESGARGYSVNGLGDPRFPQFSLENHAKGAGTEKMNRLVNTALNIRSEAMAKRMAFILKHPEKMKEELAA